MRHHESKLQQACFGYFRLQYPEYGRLFFSVPNGAHVSEIQAKVLKGEGMTAGVADAMLLVPSLGYHGLMIEFKTLKGRQSDHQKAFQEAVTNQGYRYVIIRTFQQFAELMRLYLCRGASEVEQSRDRLTALLETKKKKNITPKNDQKQNK